jgi:hypothetical protein
MDHQLDNNKCVRCKEQPCDDGKKTCLPCRESANKRKLVSNKKKQEVKKAKQTEIFEQSVTDKTIASDIVREVNTKREHQVDGSITEHIREKKVELTKEESTRHAVHQVVERAVDTVRHGDVERLLGENGPKKILQLWSDETNVQYRALKAAGYDYDNVDYFDFDSILAMIEDKKEGAYEAKACTFFLDSRTQQDDDYDETYKDRSMMQRFAILSKRDPDIYKSDLDRFFWHCVNGPFKEECVPGWKVNPLLAAMPYSVLISILDELEKRKTGLNWYSAIESDVDFMIYQMAVAKAVLGSSDLRAKRYRVKKGIEKDKKENSFLELDISQFDIGNTTKMTLYVNGKEAKKMKLNMWQVCDPFILTLVFPMYRSLFLEQIIKDGEENKQETERYLTYHDSKSGQHSGNLLLHMME